MKKARNFAMFFFVFFSFIFCFNHNSNMTLWRPFILLSMPALFDRYII